MDTAAHDLVSDGASDDDVLMFAFVGLAVVVGAVLGSVEFVVFGLIASSIVAARRLPTGGLASAIALGLLWSNASVVLGRELGAPVILALLPQGILAGLFLYRVVTLDRSIVITGPFRWMLAYGGVLFVSGVFAADASPLIEKYQAYISEGLLVWFLISNVVLDRRALERAMAALAIAGGVMGALVAVQFLTSGFTDNLLGFAQVEDSQLDLFKSRDGYTPRLSGAIGEKNRFAQVLVVTLPIALVMARGRRGRAAAVFLVSAAFILMGIAFSGSRGGAVGVVLVVVVLVAVKAISLRSLMVAGGAVAGLLLLLPTYRNRVASSASIGEGVSSSEVDGATLSRITSNLAAFDMFVDHPLLGVGPGGYPVRYESYAELIGLKVRDGTRQPHNLYLHIASELGYAGLLVFLAMFATLIWRLWVMSRSDARRGVVDPVHAGMLGGLVGYAATGVFLHLSFERFFWALLALSDVATRVLPVRSSEAAAVGEQPTDRRSGARPRVLDTAEPLQATEAATPGAAADVDRVSGAG